MKMLKQMKDALALNPPERLLLLLEAGDVNSRLPLLEEPIDEDEIAAERIRDLRFFTVCSVNFVPQSKRHKYCDIWH